MGEARLREYESQGQTRTSLELRVGEIALQGKGEAKQEQGFRDNPTPQQVVDDARKYDPDPMEQDDIPF